MRVGHAGCRSRNRAPDGPVWDRSRLILLSESLNSGATSPVPPAALVVKPPLFLVLDACVLMSSILRPLLLDLAAQGWYRPVWSERIGLEWRRNAARIWGVAPEALADEWAAMSARFPGAEQGALEAYEAGLRYSDAKDWHVIAAGLASRARSASQATPEVRVLTWNLKDFNRGELKRQAMSAWDPDRQLSAWLEQDPPGVAPLLAGVRRHALARGRDEPLFETLKRERLFRCGRLLAAMGEPS